MPVNVFTTIDDPSAKPGTTEAFGINNMGQIVGQFQDHSGLHGFLRSGGTLATVDDPSGSGLDVQALGINDAGQIVGLFDSIHGFLLSGGVFTTIDDPAPRPRSRRPLALTIKAKSLARLPTPAAPTVSSGIATAPS